MLFGATSGRSIAWVDGILHDQTVTASLTEWLTCGKGITIAADFCLSLHPDNSLLILIRDTRSVALRILVDLCIGLSKGLSAAYRMPTPARRSSLSLSFDIKSQASVDSV